MSVCKLSANYEQESIDTDIEIQIDAANEDDEGADPITLAAQARAAVTAVNKAAAIAAASASAIIDAAAAVRVAYINVHRQLPPRPAPLLRPSRIQEAGFAQLLATGITPKQAATLVRRKGALSSWQDVYTALHSYKAVDALQAAGYQP